MKSLKALAALAAAACLSLPGCGSLKRVGTDLAVVVTSPITIPLSAVHDSLNWGADTKDATPMLLAPLNIPLHALKHAAYTIVYAADAIVSPLYLIAGIPDLFTGGDKHDLAPIDLYVLNEGYPWKSTPWPHFED